MINEHSRSGHSSTHSHVYWNIHQLTLVETKQLPEVHVHCALSWLNIWYACMNTWPPLCVREWFTKPGGQEYIIYFQDWSCVQIRLGPYPPIVTGPTVPMWVKLAVRTAWTPSMSLSTLVTFIYECTRSDNTRAHPPAI